jgi:hypothetical protein
MTFLNFDADQASVLLNQSFGQMQAEEVNVSPLTNMRDR